MGWMLHMSSAVVKPGLPSPALVHKPRIIRLLRGAYCPHNLVWVAVVRSYIGVPLMDTEVRLVGSRKEGSTDSGLDQARLRSTSALDCRQASDLVALQDGVAVLSISPIRNHFDTVRE